MASRHLWRASSGIATSHKVVHVNRNSPVVLRAPMEAQGHFALECAMDELAYATGVDPVELRLRNDTDTDPYSGRPFSTRALRECLTKGAARFGWDKRTPEARSMRDGRYLIGQGVAAAIYTHWRWPGKARVTLNGDGSALVEAAAHDIGTGAYTVMAQVAGRRARPCARQSDRSARRHPAAGVAPGHRISDHSQRNCGRHAGGTGRAPESGRTGAYRARCAFCRRGARRCGRR